MRVTLDWDDAPALASNFNEAVRALVGDAGLWDLAASSNGDLIEPDGLVRAGAVADVEDAEDIQTALGDFDAARSDPEALADVADRLDLDSLPNGSHFAGYGRELTVPGMFNLRGAFGDDGDRLTLDRNRWDRGSPHLQILFDRKYIDRHENPANTDEDGPTWQSGRPARWVAGSEVLDSSARLKDPDSGRLDYQKVLEQLADHPDFDSRAAVMRRVQERGSVDVSTDPSKRGYDLANGRRPFTRNEQKALRDYAEDRSLGHYRDGRARDMEYEDTLPEGTADRRRRCLIEYVDIVWDQGGPEDRDPGDDYFRELNVTTSTVNENNTNRQMKVTHDKAVQRAMDALNPTSSKNGVTLTHDRDRAANIDAAIGALPDGAGGPSRNPDSLNWEDRRLDSDEVERYLDNLTMHTSNPAHIDRAETNPLVEVTLYGDDPVGAPDPIWHVIVIDDGDRLADGTIIEDSRGWWT
jgi:hypothetical protein